MKLRFLTLAPVFLLGIFGSLACNRGPRPVRISLSIVGAQGPGQPAHYDTPEIYVPASTEVTIFFHNSDGALVHNFLLVQPGSVRLPAPKPADILAESPPLPPLSDAVFHFMAPPPGNYEFFCNGPGHESPNSAQAATETGAQTAALARGKFIVQ